MRVCIDATPMDSGHRFRGIGRYVQGLMHALAESDLPFPVTELRRAGGGPDTGGQVQTTRIGRPRWPRTRLQWLWNEIRLPGEVAATGCALFHATDPQGVAPDGRYRTVATAYDLAHLRFPEAYYAPAGADERLCLRRMEARYQRADHLIALSQATKQEFVELLGIAPERISVVHLAWDPERFETTGEPAKIGVSLPERFFLYVGAVDPRKNVHGMLEAFSRVKERVPESFVLAGKFAAADGSALGARIRALGIEERVVHVDFVPDGALGALYRAATAFVFPSRYEGFGLPVLEAMGCGCPVITGTLSSLPEIAGDAAILVPPDDTEAIADALLRISEDGDLRHGLRAKGLARAGQFTWERCAAETIEVYKRVAAS